MSGYLVSRKYHFFSVHEMSGWLICIFWCPRNVIYYVHEMSCHKFTKFCVHEMSSILSTKCHFWKNTFFCVHELSYHLSTKWHFECPPNVVKNVHEMSSTPCRVFELYSRYASYFGRKGASKSLVWLWKFLRWKYLLLFIWWQKWKHSKECQKYLS